MIATERNYWLAFSYVKGIGAVRFRKLLDYFGTLENAWKGTASQWGQAGLTEKVILELRQVQEAIQVEKLQENLSRKGISFLTWEDLEYPKYLNEINQPPPVLYYKGSIKAEDDLAIAIVGTRNVTAYGRQLTKDTAAFMAGNGVTVVSGLARGVDAIAHQSALEMGGRTLAVLGSGVDVIYPHEHRQLAEKIALNGAIISDYPPGTKPEAINFPPRNRIISGLSRGTIVIEAGERSGALITAKFAADQGREVFAVPGSVLSPMSKGTNSLISSGAIPMTSPSQVLKHLNIQKMMQTIRVEALPELNEDEAKIIKALGEEAWHIDDLCIKLDMSIEKLTVQLTLMELKGLIQREKNMEFRAVRHWHKG